MRAGKVGKKIAIVGAGVSGLTCGVIFAEAGRRVTILAEETGGQTTSAAAAAIWFPYDAEPAERIFPWALETYRAFQELSREPKSGVTMIELRSCSRRGEIQIPSWAHSLGARLLRKTSSWRDELRASQTYPSRGSIPDKTGAARSSALHTTSDELPTAFASGFALTVPLIDTTIYLNYLAARFRAAGGEITDRVCLRTLEQVDPRFDPIINCAGIGARELADDAELEPHRGQIAIVRKLELSYAIACDDAPLMYAIPRTNDCVFGGTNDLSNDRAADPAARARILAECSRVLAIAPPEVSADRVGLRPFRKSGVRLEIDRLTNGRTLIHNYGHGGAGFTLSWACARKVFALARPAIAFA